MRVNPASAAAVHSTQEGHRGLLSSMKHQLATDASAPFDSYGRYTLRDFEAAKDVQDRLAAAGVGTPMWTGPQQSEAEEIRDNAAFLQSFRRGVCNPAGSGGNYSTSDKPPGGYECVDGADALAGDPLDPRSGGARIWVDPNGAKQVKYERADKTVVEMSSLVVDCEWSDPLASELATAPPGYVGALPSASTDPFDLFMGTAASGTVAPARYLAGAIERFNARIVRLGPQRTDAYLKAMYIPAEEYRRAEWVSDETENRFRAWTSSEHNNGTSARWAERITKRLACTYADTVHATERTLTLTFRQPNKVFINAILETVSGTGEEALLRCVGHYYTFSVQLLARMTGA